MIEISLNTNFPQVSLDLKQTIVDKILTDNHPILIAAASSVLAMVHHRIHTEGRRANGSAIGRYSPKYLKYRQGPKFNRTSDPTMIFSLTSQMELDFTVVAVGDSVGLGFNNEYNYRAKALNLEKTHPGTYLLSDEEELIAVEAVNEYINGLFT